MPSASFTAAIAATVPPASASGLRLRVVSAALLALPTLLLLWAGGPLWRLFVAVCGGVLAWEWTVLCRAGRASAGDENESSALASMAVVLTVPLAVVVGGLASDLWALTALVLGAVAVIARTAQARLGQGLWLGAGIFYVGLPCLAIVWLRETMGLGVLLWIMALVWATDTAAYVAGRRFGGPKLAPRVSPNKTWSGLAGGICGAAVAGGIVGAIMDTGTAVALALMSAGLAVVEQAGDLAESAVKRRFGVKDASALIPGHGGLLDRVDGLLAVVAAVWLLARAELLPWS